MHQVTLEVDRKVATLQSAAKDGHREMFFTFFTDKAGRDGSKSAAGFSERTSELHFVSVRSIHGAGKAAESELTAESELPGEHCGEAATRHGQRNQR